MVTIYEREEAFFPTYIRIGRGIHERTERIESAEGKDEIIRSRLPETKSLCQKIGKSRKIIPAWGLSTAPTEINQH